MDMFFILYKNGAIFNYGGYVNEEYTALTEDARTVHANDPVNILKITKRQKILLEQDAAQVPLPKCFKLFDQIKC